MRVSTILQLIALSLIAYSPLEAQEQTYSIDWTAEQADSVKSRLTKSTNDTLRMKMARMLGIYYQEINRDTSLKYHQLQIQLAKKINHFFG